jgi:hypothetical protein
MSSRSREQRMTDGGLHSHLPLSAQILSQPYASDLGSRPSQTWSPVYRLRMVAAKSHKAGALHGHVPIMRNCMIFGLQANMSKTASMKSYGIYSDEPWYDSLLNVSMGHFIPWLTYGHNHVSYFSSHLISKLHSDQHVYSLTSHFLLSRPPSASTKGFAFTRTLNHAEHSSRAHSVERRRTSWTNRAYGYLRHGHCAPQRSHQTRAVSLQQPVYPRQRPQGKMRLPKKRKTPKSITSRSKNAPGPLRTISSC